MLREPHPTHRWYATLITGVSLCGCLSGPAGLDPIDAAMNGADGSTDDASPPDGQPIDATPSANTHSVLFTPADDSYLAAADQVSGLDVTDAMTFEAWVKLASLPASGERYSIAVKSDTGALQDSYSFAIVHEPGTGHRMTARVYGTASASPERDGVGWDWPTLAADTWYHLAVTYDLAQSTVLSRFRFYLDGTEVSGGLLLLDGNIDTIRDSTAPLVIGARVTGGSTSELFDGQIDDVRIWNLLRSQGEISANRAVELTGSESGLLGYWQLDGGLLDEAANTNDLAVTGSPAPAFVTDRPF